MQIKQKILAPFVILITALSFFSCYGKTEGAGESIAAPEGMVPDGNKDMEQPLVYQSGDTIELHASRFLFEPNRIVVQKGAEVDIAARSTDIPHGLAISEYGINVDLPANVEKTIKLTADKEGTFTFYCTVYCGAGHRNMRGTLVVR